MNDGIKSCKQTCGMCTINVALGLWMPNAFYLGRLRVVA